MFGMIFFFYHLKTHAQILDTNMESITIVLTVFARQWVFFKNTMIFFVVSPKFGGTTKSIMVCLKKGLLNVVSF